jgi:hypothetical protein
MVGKGIEDVTFFLKHNFFKKQFPYSITLYDLYHSFPLILVIRMLKNYDNHF